MNTPDRALATAVLAGRATVLGMAHRRNSHHWNPPLSPKKLAAKKQREHEAWLRSLTVTIDDLRPFILDPVPVAADQGGDKSDDSGPDAA